MMPESRQPMLEKIKTLFLIYECQLVCSGKPRTFLPGEWKCYIPWFMLSDKTKLDSLTVTRNKKHSFRHFETNYTCLLPPEGSPWGVITPCKCWLCSWPWAYGDPEAQPAGSHRLWRSVTKSSNFAWNWISERNCCFSPHDLNDLPACQLLRTCCCWSSCWRTSQPLLPSLWSSLELTMQTREGQPATAGDVLKGMRFKAKDGHSQKAKGGFLLSASFTATSNLIRSLLNLPL